LVPPLTCLRIMVLCLPFSLYPIRYMSLLVMVLVSQFAFIAVCTFVYLHPTLFQKVCSVFPLSLKTSYMFINSLVIMPSLLNLTHLVSLLRTSRPDTRSSAAIAPTTSTTFHLNQSPHHSKFSSPASLLHLFGTLALVIPAPLPSTTFKGLASLRVIRVITARVTLASLGSNWGSHLVLPLHPPSVRLN
jgi:hypothetical protein